MNRKKLDKKLNEWVKDLPQKNRKELIVHLSGLRSVFPFNEYEYRLMYLLDRKVISFGEYESLRKVYVAANSNLHLYGIAPRVFGDIWGSQHLMSIDSRFKKPSKEVDKNYSGEYDLYLKDGKKIIKIEVKASRATNTKVRGSIEETALNFKSKEPYWMNFQQLKPDMADVFIFIGVWTDKIIYWILTSSEVKNHPTISHQHRGGIEYQIGIKHNNFDAFKELAVKSTRLVNVIKAKIKK